jgi:hypothetical protein
MDFLFRAPFRLALRHVVSAGRGGMDAFGSFLLLLPSGASGHDRDAERLRVIAELHLRSVRARVVV